MADKYLNLTGIAHFKAKSDDTYVSSDDTRHIYVSDTAPSGAQNGDIWIDTSSDPLAGKMNMVSSPVAGEILTTNAGGQAVSSGTDLNTLLYDVDAGKTAFMLKDFNQTLNISIPPVTQDIANTSIPNVDIDLNVIDPTGKLNTNYAIAGIAKYEVFDATSGGNRLNAFPVCSFSMNSQRTLRVRMMVGGTLYMTARRIQGALLLKHR